MEGSEGEALTSPCLRMAAGLVSSAGPAAAALVPASPGVSANRHNCPVLVADRRCRKLRKQQMTGEPVLARFVESSHPKDPIFIWATAHLG